MSLRTRLALAAGALVTVTTAITVAMLAAAARSGWLGDLRLTDAFAQTAGPAWLAGWPTPLRLAAFAAAAALVAVAVAVPLAHWLASLIAHPLDQAAAAAEAVVGGDLRHPLVLGGGDESGRLLAAVAALQHALGGLATAIRDAAGRLAGVDADTTAALRHQERVVGGFSGSAHEITAAVAEISATSEQLLEATGDVMTSAREAALVADEGREGLDSMAASMQHLDDAMNAFTRKLATISQRAAGITSVVTTIAKVAEQTNLLSVNATIEAEKAGESGRGFRIVAQEIRRLADQTAQATKDIERLVRDMQAAVAGGTMEMDRFRNEVGSRTGEVAAVSEKLGRIIEPVQSVTRSLEQVHEGMTAQSQGARQIRAAMESLRGDAAESATSLEAFAAALDAIRGVTTDLEAEVARFGEASR